MAFVGGRGDFSQDVHVHQRGVSGVSDDVYEGSSSRVVYFIS